LGPNPRSRETLADTQIAGSVTHGKSSTTRLDEFTKAIEAQPKDPNNYRNRAQVYELIKQAERAIADYGKVIEWAPKDADAYAKRGQLEVQTKKYDAAIKDLSRVALCWDRPTISVSIESKKNECCPSPSLFANHPFAKTRNDSVSARVFMLNCATRVYSEYRLC
jgi:regulator of sirC expression with transglutaminase-like and TPR domain